MKYIRSTHRRKDSNHKKGKRGGETDDANAQHKENQESVTETRSSETPESQVHSSTTGAQGEEEEVASTTREGKTLDDGGGGGGGGGRMESEAMLPVTQNENGLNSAFLLVYKIIMLMSIAIVVGMFVFAMMDLVVYLSRQVDQYRKSKTNPYIFIKDTLEYNILKSYISNNSNEEVFSFLLQVSLMNWIFMICGFGVFVLIGLQILIFMIMKIRCRQGCSGVDKNVDIPMQRIGVILTILAVILLINQLFTQKFVRDIQPYAATTYNRLSEIKRAMYSSMTTSLPFLSSLTSDNLGACVQHIKDVAAQANKTEGERIDEITKCHLTIGIYMSYRYNISEMDEEFPTVMSMFSYNGIRKRTIDPVQYMFYNKRFLMPDVYSALAPYVGNALRDANIDQGVQALYMHRVDEINRRLLGMNSLEKLKSKVFGLINLFLLFIIILMVILLIIFYKHVLQFSTDVLGAMYRRK